MGDVFEWRLQHADRPTAPFLRQLQHGRDGSWPSLWQLQRTEQKPVHAVVSYMENNDWDKHRDNHSKLPASRPTKWAPNWCFGLLERKFNRTEAHCLADTVRTVETSPWVCFDHKYGKIASLPVSRIAIYSVVVLFMLWCMILCMCWLVGYPLPLVLFIQSCCCYE